MTIHYYGNPLNETCMDLGEEAKRYMDLHCDQSKLDTSRPFFVSFIDSRIRKRRFAKMEFLAGQWVFTDIIDFQ